MFKWPFGKKAREERAAEEARQRAEDEALDAELEELLQESEALERGELPSKASGAEPPIETEPLPEGAAEMLVAMGRAGRRLIIVRTGKRVLQLLRAHPESQALANPIAALGTGTTRCEVDLGLLPANTEIPVPHLDADVNVPRGAGDTKVLVLMEIEMELMQASISFDMANMDVDKDPLSRAAEIIKGHHMFFEACSKLDRQAPRALRLAAMQDMAGAMETAESNSWTDETTLASDPLGALWPEGISVEGAEDEESADNGADRLQAQLAQRLRAHRDRMLAVEHPDHDFIQQAFSDEDIALLAGIAAEKMRLTLDDGDVHSTLMAGPEMAVVIYTMKGSVGEAALWYEENHGGYTKMMDKYMSGPEVTGSGSEVLCHLTFGHTGDEAWVNVTLMPLSGDRFRQAPMIAMDLLSEAEKAQSGFA